MFDYEEPYYEQTIADEIYREASDKLKEALNAELKYNLKCIADKNKELKEQNEKLKSQVDAIAERERKLEYEKSDMLRTVRRERLSELMEDFNIIMYRAYSSSMYMPKCDKCDDNRKIHFESPRGEKLTENCKCAHSENFYFPTEHVCTEFKVNSEKQGKMRMWFKLHREHDYDYYDYESNDYLDTIYKKGMNYEDLNNYKTFFDSKEECRKYCEWLNKGKDVNQYPYDSIKIDADNPRKKKKMVTGRKE